MNTTQMIEGVLGYAYPVWVTIDEAAELMPEYRSRQSAREHMNKLHRMGRASRPRHIPQPVRVPRHGGRRMPMSPINAEYDKANDGSVIDWEEHKGLAVRVAQIMCKRDSRLEPYFDDITTDLWLVLWRCALPENFSRDKARFSTYACRSMLRTYDDMCTMYLGYNHRRKYNGKDDISIYTPVGSGLELIDCIPAKDEPEPKCIEDYEYAYGAVLQIVGEKKMDQMTNPEVRRESSSTASYAKRRAMLTIQRLRAINPAFIEKLEEALGVVA